MLAHFDSDLSIEPGHPNGSARVTAGLTIETGQRLSSLLLGRPQCLRQLTLRLDKRMDEAVMPVHEPSAESGVRSLSASGAAAIQ